MAAARPRQKYYITPQSRLQVVILPLTNAVSFAIITLYNQEREIMKAYIKSRMNQDGSYTHEAYDLRTGDAIGMQKWCFDITRARRGRRELQRDMMLENIIPVSQCGKVLCYYDENATDCVAYLTEGLYQ